MIEFELNVKLNTEEVKELCKMIWEVRIAGKDGLADRLSSLLGIIEIESTVRSSTR